MGGALTTFLEEELAVELAAKINMAKSTAVDDQTRLAGVEDIPADVAPPNPEV